MSGGKSNLDRFELRHLRYFVALVEERNFERAANRLGIAQPALSQQVQSLELIVGLPLIDRKRRGVQLTIPGELLYQEACTVLRHAEGALTALRRVGRGETGKISVGFVASAALSGALVKTISSFRKQFPGIEFQLTEMEVRRQFQRLAGGDLDFCYIRSPVEAPTGVSIEVIQREPLVAVLPEGHPLSLRKSVRVREVAEEPILTIRQPANVAFHQLAASACREAGVNATIKPIGADFTELGTLVGVGMGACLLSKSFERMQLPGVCFVPLSDCEITSDVSIAFRSNESSPAVVNFIAHCKTMARSMLED